MPPARMSAKKPARRARARRSSRSWRLHVPVLEQRHLDLIGLGLLAAGVFLAFPLYLGWDGGAVGRALVDGLTWLLGRVAYAVPPGLVAACRPCGRSVLRRCASWPRRHSRSLRGRRG